MCTYIKFLPKGYVWLKTRAHFGQMKYLVQKQMVPVTMVYFELILDIGASHLMVLVRQMDVISNVTVSATIFCELYKPKSSVKWLLWAGLLLDDIIISARCAQKIYTQSKRGFKPWAGWAAKCQRRRLPNLTYCFLQPAFNYSSITF